MRTSAGIIEANIGIKRIVNVIVSPVSKYS